MRQLTLFLSSLLLLVSFGASNASNVAIGNCIVIVEQNNVTNSNVVATDIGCPQDPNTAIRVKYFWLDSASFSLLNQGYTDFGIDKLVGSNPFIINTPANLSFSELIKRFGTYADSSSAFDGEFITVSTHHGGGNRKKHNTDEIDFEPGKNTRQFEIAFPPGKRPRIYDANDLIYIADPNLIKELYNSSEWPIGFHKAYRSSWGYAGFTTNTDDIQKIISSNDLRQFQEHLDDPVFPIETYYESVIWRQLKKSDIEDYYRKARQVAKEIDREGYSNFTFSMGTHKYTGDEVGNLSDQDNIYTITYQLNLRAFRNNFSVISALYYTRDHFPSDFMKLYGFMESHVGDEEFGWNFVSIPRKPYVLVAVVENIGGAGALYDLKEFRATKSISAKLRDAKSEEMGAPFSIEYIPQKFRSGDTIVLPLKIELRDYTYVGRQDVPISVEPINNPVMEAFFKKVIKFGSELNTTGFHTPLVKKQIKSFAQSEIPPTARTYLYGQSINIDSVVINGKAWPLRQFNPNRTYMVAGFEGGSCPILYFQRHGESEATKVGRILREANGEERIQTQEIFLGENVNKIVIAEEEPEVATIKSIEFYGVDEDGGENLIKKLPINKKIHAGNHLEISLSDLDDVKLKLKITGYYEPYAKILSKLNERHSAFAPN